MEKANAPSGQNSWLDRTRRVVELMSYPISLAAVIGIFLDYIVPALWLWPFHTPDIAHRKMVDVLIAFLSVFVFAGAFVRDWRRSKGIKN